MDIMYVSEKRRIKKNKDGISYPVKIPANVMTIDVTGISFKNTQD